MKPFPESAKEIQNKQIVNDFSKEQLLSENYGLEDEARRLQKLPTIVGGGGQVSELELNRLRTNTIARERNDFVNRFNLEVTRWL